MVSRHSLATSLCILLLGVSGHLLIETARAEPAVGPRVATISAALAAPYRSKQRRMASGLGETDARALLDLHELHEGGMRIARLAQTHAQSTQTRRSGQLQAQDHARRDQRVIALARQRGIDLESLTAAEQASYPVQQRQQLVDRLQTLSGEDFDREFSKAVVENNGNAIQMVAERRASAHDPELRFLLDGTLPMLRQHLGMARKLTAGR